MDDSINTGTPSTPASQDAFSAQAQEYENPCIIPVAPLKPLVRPSSPFCSSSPSSSSSSCPSPSSAPLNPLPFLIQESPYDYKRDDKRSHRKDSKGNVQYNKIVVLIGSHLIAKSHPILLVLLYMHMSLLFTHILTLVRTSSFALAWDEVSYPSINSRILDIYHRGERRW